ncbi:hypothetical protein Hpkin61_07510 [Helicobacter pylori]
MTSPARTSLKIPPNAKIKKSTILVLKGENVEEVAKILGISKEEYQKLENIAQTNATNDPMYANTPFSNGSDSSAYDNNPNNPSNNAINGKDGANGSNVYGVNGNDGVNGISGSNGVNGSNSNNNAIGSGIDTDGVLGVDGVNGLSEIIQHVRLEPTHSDQAKTKPVFKGFHVSLLVGWLEYYNNIFNSLFLRIFFIL